MKLAAYTVALNESAHVARWLDTTKHFDHRLVVDTGSTDGTPELLEAAGVLVFRASVRPWRFDQARNTALALLPHDIDVCLTLDMDELVADDFADTVRTSWNGAHQGWVPFDTGSTWLAPRLHSRHGWVWKYPIHETLTWVGDGTPTSVTLPTRMWHQPDNSKSRGQYLPMLQRAVVELPDDHRMHTYLVRELFFHQRWADVLAAATNAQWLDGWDVERAAICRWAAHAAHHLGDDAAAAEWADDAVKASPDAESWHVLALANYWNQRWEACLLAATRAYEAPASAHYLHDATIHEWRAADLAAIAAWHVGDRAAAVRWAERIDLTTCPDAERIKANMDWFVT